MVGLPPSWNVKLELTWLDNRELSHLLGWKGKVRGLPGEKAYYAGAGALYEASRSARSVNLSIFFSDDPFHIVPGGPEMPYYCLPCPYCGEEIELDTDIDYYAVCEFCDEEFEWMWFGKGNLVLHQNEEIPMFLYPGAGQFRC